MTNDIGNYARHARYWDWGGQDRSPEHKYWLKYAEKYGKNVLIPMCALGETGAYMAKRGMSVTAFDITPEMITEGKKRFDAVPGLRLLEGDVRGFRFDINPADFCFCTDFGHLHTIDDMKKALVCINNHLRDGGCLVIKTELRMPGEKLDYHPPETFYPLTQVYPDMKVWKTGDTRNDADTGRCYISQTFYAEDKNGNVERFDHAFYLQGYYLGEWLEAFAECGFTVSAELDDGGFHIFEAVKPTKTKKRYSPAVSFDYLQTPIYRYENVTLNTKDILFSKPNDGYFPLCRFDITVEGEWVGWIHVIFGYSVKTRYAGHIAYALEKKEHHNKGYMTKACLALKPFLQKCGFGYVLITNDENNVASRRVCKKIGANLLETVDTPTWSGMYGNGQRRTCIYEWAIEDAVQKDSTKMNLQHIKIDPEADRDYILERHCKINYECDTPWARKIPYAEYRTRWYAWQRQREGFLSALRDSMGDGRTIAEIIKNEAGEKVGYLWIPFHGEDANFIWADVQDIYVEEAYRKTGVASYLMDYAEQSVKKNGAKVIRAGTGCENIASQGLHQKLGYYQYHMEYEKVLQEDTQNG